MNQLQYGGRGRFRNPQVYRIITPYNLTSKYLYQSQGQSNTSFVYYA